MKIQRPIAFITVTLGFFSVIGYSQINRTEIHRTNSAAGASTCPTEISGEKINWYMNVVFSKSFADNTQAENPENYRLLDLVALRSGQASSSIKPVRAINISKPYEAKLPAVTLCFAHDLIPPKRSLIENQYQLHVSSIDFVQSADSNASDLKTMIFANIGFLDKNDLPDTLDNRPPKKVWSAAENSDDAVIYAAGELTKTSGAKVLGSADLRFEYRWDRGSNTYRPFFALKASSDLEADPDSMKFGFGWNRQLKTYGRSSRFMRLKSVVEGGIEAERDFDTSNLYSSARLYLQSKRKGLLFDGGPWLDFFAGLEIGKNLTSPVSEAKGKSISRGLFGAVTGKSFKLNSRFFDSLQFAGSFERRILFTREVGFEKVEDDKSLRPVYFDKRPRDWAEAKITLLTKNKFWGIFASYEYGEQPPAYKLVDHRSKFGLVFSVLRDNKD